MYIVNLTKEILSNILFLVDVADPKCPARKIAPNSKRSKLSNEVQYFKRLGSTVVEKNIGTLT